jgi:FkbM family methyltransferase
VSFIKNKTCQIPNLQDIYTKFFGNKKDGFFVDVGAFDGYMNSNTNILANAGWKGILIEPIPRYAYGCHLYHRDAKQHAISEEIEVDPEFTPNDVIIWNVAVGGYTGIVEIQECQGMSSINPEFLEAASKIEIPAVIEYYKKWLGEKIKVPQLFLGDILTISDVPYGFEVLDIDVEGYEWEILWDFELSAWDPKMVVVEVHEKSPEWQKFEFMQKKTKIINEYFEEYKYEKYYSDDVNNIYIKGI